MMSRYFLSIMISAAVSAAPCVALNWAAAVSGATRTRVTDCRAREGEVVTMSLQHAAYLDERYWLDVLPSPRGAIELHAGAATGGRPTDPGASVFPLSLDETACASLRAACGAGGIEWKYLPPHRASERPQLMVADAGTAAVHWASGQFTLDVAAPDVSSGASGRSRAWTLTLRVPGANHDQPITLALAGPQLTWLLAPLFPPDARDFAQPRM